MNRRAIILEVVLLAACCGFLFFYGLGSFGLVGADEPRYAQVAREMLARHDWVTPVLYGQPWLEKPILYYWRAMVAFSVFGINDSAARLPSATFAALMAVFTYFWAWKFRPSARLDAALMMVSSALVIGFARAASTDMSLAAPFTIGMLSWFGWYKTRHRAWLAVFYVFIALGMLAKGPVAPVLAGAIIVAFAFMVRERMLILQTLWVPGVLLFLLVALPWYIAVQIRNPQFLHVFIFEHNLARFGTNMFRHKQPFWYYLPVLLLGVAPWTVFVVTGIVDAVKRMRKTITDDDGFATFLVIWTALPILFFSISQSKLPGYILPSIPPALILGADYLTRRWESGERIAFWMIALHVALVSVLIAVLFLAPAQLVRAAAPVQAIMLAAGAGTVCFIAIAVAVLLRGYPMLRLATVVAMVLAIGFIIRVLSPVIDMTQSERVVAATVQELAPNIHTVATFKARREVEYGVAFYRNQPVKVYERLEIPDEEHVVICRTGCEGELREISPGRTVQRIGEVSAQRLEFFSVGGR
jgi:4-amino-4-deoxy-L-arabinose transferase-like glycosyltransferase